MAGADLTGADLRRASFHRVDLTGADLSGADLTVAELHSSRLTSARFVGARAIGTVVRECVLDGAEIARAVTYRTQILRCTPAPEPTPGLLIAPLPGDGSQAARDVSPLRPLTGHTGGVWAVAWSPDGTRLLTGGYGGARVWDAATAEPLHQLTGHTGWVRAVAWSPDGTRLLTGGGDDGTVRVWDAATAEPLHQLTGHPGGVSAVAWSPDGTRLLTGSTDGTTRMWDATSGLPIGFTIVTLPGRELAIFDTIADQLVRASEGAWRWLGWNVVEDGWLTRLPAESFGALPPLHPAARSAESA